MTVTAIRRSSVETCIYDGHIYKLIKLPSQAYKEKMDVSETKKSIEDLRFAKQINRVADDIARDRVEKRLLAQAKDALKQRLKVGRLSPAACEKYRDSLLVTSQMIDHEMVRLLALLDQ